MAIAWYESLSLADLRKVAQKEGLKDPEAYDADELIEYLEDIEEEKLLERLQNNDVMRLKGKKYDIFQKNGEDETRLEYELPDIYSDTKIVLLLRDPFWAFAYWDIHNLDLMKVKESNPDLELFLRVYELEHPDDDIAEALGSFEIPVQETDTSWYINLPNPSRGYKVELFCDCMENCGEVFLMAKSNAVESPGGYWLEHTESLKTQDRELDLLLSGLSDAYGTVTDNPLIEKILTEAGARSPIQKS